MFISPPAEDSEPALEHEIKFLVPPARAAAALACLRSLCRPDPVYPANHVLSLYYDTRGLDLLHDKLDSHLAKTKVRLRWYEDPATRQAGNASFLEIKRRLGTRRAKTRRETGLSGKRIAAGPLGRRELEELPSLLTDDLPRTRGRLHPLLVVRYHRRRFDDPLSGTRISIDSRISVPRINSRLLPRRRPGRLAATVVEIKNRQGRLPAHLAPLLGLGSRLASFSKYAACFQQTVSGTPLLQ